jgi:class 3 adenylate cyclase/YHS domain-containing protein
MPEEPEATFTGDDRPVEATFAFVDLAGFTALTEAHGDAEAVAIVRAFRDRALEVLGPGDELVKTIGDAVMFAFPTPHAAVRALRELLERELRHDDAILMPRIGAHHGAAVATDGDYYGAAVNLAARVASEARGGEFLVTNETAFAARDAGAIVTHVGAVELRNISRPVDIFAVCVTDPSSPAAVDPVCRMRVPMSGETAVTLEWAGRTIHFCGLPCVSTFAQQSESYLAAAAQQEPSPRAHPD